MMRSLHSRPLIQPQKRSLAPRVRPSRRYSSQNAPPSFLSPVLPPYVSTNSPRFCTTDRVRLPHPAESGSQQTVPHHSTHIRNSTASCPCEVYSVDLTSCGFSWPIQTVNLVPSNLVR